MFMVISWENRKDPQGIEQTFHNSLGHLLLNPLSKLKGERLLAKRF